MENKGTNGKVQRGEIYLYDFGNNGGSIQNGVRPALVVQCDEGNAASSTTIIAAMTSIIKKQYLPSHIILGDRFGLKEPSMVMLEQLKTVNQSDLIEYIGKIDDEHYMKKINSRLSRTLSLLSSTRILGKGYRNFESTVSVRQQRAGQVCSPAKRSALIAAQSSTSALPRA